MQYTGAGAAAADHGRIVRAGAPHCRAGTPPLLEPALQQLITTILSVSAYLFASAASVLQGRWIYHKSTGPRGEWDYPATWATGWEQWEMDGLERSLPAGDVAANCRCCRAAKQP